MWFYERLPHARVPRFGLLSTRLFFAAPTRSVYLDVTSGYHSVSSTMIVLSDRSTRVSFAKRADVLLLRTGRCFAGVVSFCVVAAFATATCLGNGASAASAKPPISFSREIRPIFANSCFACHGTDAAQRKADLRLDVRAIAVHEAIVPGNSADSPLIDRVSSSDPDDQMPPPASKKPRLTPDAIAKLRRWIDEGAKYETALGLQGADAASGACDDRDGRPRKTFRRLGPQRDRPLRRRRLRGARALRLARRRSRHADPPLAVRPHRPAADARRGATLSPTDHSPAAYEKMVDRLLASPHFGERMAVYWLDLVRYADTGGYHSDNQRDVWLYRDYVIKAFNDNKPFDRFTIEQLAGDLLPGATREQKIASGYNRLLQTTEEGGAQAKEYTAKYAADRVRNASAVWLGSTMGCCQCHDHKFDPFTTKDFYSFAAFFADVREKAVQHQDQTPMPSPEQAARLKQLDDQIAAAGSCKTPAWPLGKRIGRRGSNRRQATRQRCPNDVGAALNAKPAKRTAKQKQIVRTIIESTFPMDRRWRPRSRTSSGRKPSWRPRFPRRSSPFPIRRGRCESCRRGNWQDDSGAIVAPAMPDFSASWT